MASLSKHYNRAAEIFLIPTTLYETIEEDGSSILAPSLHTTALIIGLYRRIQQVIGGLMPLIFLFEGLDDDAESSSHRAIGS
jgi:hypothetical protein